MTAIGENGRLAPGESWQRAMDHVAQQFARGAKRRYRVEARLVEPGWWAYNAVKLPKDRPGLAATEPLPMTQERLDDLAAQLPRCAARAKGSHGGGSKVAYPRERLARQAADFLGQRAYPCPLPAPAIGEHWHTTSEGGRRRA